MRGGNRKNVYSDIQLLMDFDVDAVASHLIAEKKSAAIIEKWEMSPAGKAPSI